MPLPVTRPPADDYGPLREFVHRLVDDLLWDLEPLLRWYVGSNADVLVGIAWQVGIRVPSVIHWTRTVACFCRYNSFTRQLVYSLPSELLYPLHNDWSGRA
jgi:hypothetical protein